MGWNWPGLPRLEEGIRNTLARGYWLALGTAAILLMLAAWAIGRSVESAAGSAMMIERHYQAISATDELLSLARDIETGQRGYVITGNRQFLAPYHEAIPKLKPTIAGLRALAADDEANRARIAAIEHLVEAKLRLSQGSVELRRRGDAERASAAIQTGRGRAQMDALRAAIAELRLELVSSLDRDRHQVALANRNALIQALVAGMLTLLAGGLAAFGFLRMRSRLAEKSVEVADADRRFQATFDQAAVGMAHLGPDGRWLKVNKQLCRITGYSEKEFDGTRLEITHPDDIKEDDRLRAKLLSGKLDGYKKEKRYIRKDGEPIWVNVTISAVRGQGDRPDFLVAVIEDIEERKRTQRELQSGEAQYKAIFDSAVEAIAVIDEHGVIQSTNPATLTMFGYSQKQLLGSNIAMLMPAPIAKKHDGYLSRYRETGKRAIIGFGREVEGRRSDGTIFPLDLSVAEWMSDGQRFFTGIMRDISARKVAEEGLRASEDNLRLLQNEFAHLSRVNDMGEMAAAIAHEINQPLTAISNFLNAARLEAARDHLGPERIDDLMRLAAEQAVRAGQIVRRLRDFVGKGDGSREVRKVGELLDAAIGIALVDAAARGIEVERGRQGDSCLVEADMIQMQQVIVNLLRNAVDAMDGNGPADEKRIMVATSPVGGSVEIRVADSGPGIAADMADHLFEPFMTSKASGMGMGLSVCRRLVEAHEGSIDVDPEAEGGAAFRVLLPVAKAAKGKARQD